MESEVSSKLENGSEDGKYEDLSVPKMPPPAPIDFGSLEKLHVIPANDSPLLLSSGWLLLRNTAQLTPEHQLSEWTSFAAMKKLIMLRYIGEGHNSRLFLVREGPDEYALKIYHSPLPTCASSEVAAYTRLTDADVQMNNVVKLGPVLHRHAVVHYELDGVQYAQYAVQLEFIRAESVAGAARKMSNEIIDAIYIMLREILAAMHDQAGVVHGNLTAENILLDDPTRYSAALEYKPLCRYGIQPRLVGFSKACFQVDMDDAMWARAKLDERRTLQQIAQQLHSQNETTTVLKWVNRACGNPSQEEARQRSLLRLLPTADPYDNELHSSLQMLEQPTAKLLFLIAKHFIDGQKHGAALHILQKHAKTCGKRIPEDMVRIYEQSAECMELVGEHHAQSDIDEMWESAVETAQENLGLANRTTIEVRRKNAQWKLKSGRQTAGALLFVATLQDVLKYHQRGTGQDMTESKFVERMGAAARDVKQQLEAGYAMDGDANSEALSKLRTGIEEFDLWVAAVTDQSPSTQRGSSSRNANNNEAQTAKTKIAVNDHGSKKRPISMVGDDDLENGLPSISKPLPRARRQAKGGRTKEEYDRLRPAYKMFPQLGYANPPQDDPITPSGTPSEDGQSIRETSILSKKKNKKAQIKVEENQDGDEMDEEDEG